MSKITYADKVALNENSGIADINKVKNTDMNEIKQVVNDNDDIVGDLTNLDTETKTSIVGAINELKNAEIYSTSEVKTNKVWIDGKPIYRKYMEFSVPNTGTTTLNHNLGIDVVTNISAICTISGQTVASHGYRPMPQSASGGWFGINAITTNQISFIVTNWQNNNAYITLEYTKTTD